MRGTRCTCATVSKDQSYALKEERTTAVLFCVLLSSSDVAGKKPPFGEII